MYYYISSKSGNFPLNQSTAKVADYIIF